MEKEEVEKENEKKREGKKLNIENEKIQKDTRRKKIIKTTQK